MKLSFITRFILKRRRSKRVRKKVYPSVWVSEVTWARRYGINARTEMSPFSLMTLMFIEGDTHPYTYEQGLAEMQRRIELSPLWRSEQADAEECRALCLYP